MVKLDAKEQEARHQPVIQVRILFAPLNKQNSEILLSSHGAGITGSNLFCLLSGANRIRTYITGQRHLSSTFCSACCTKLFL